LKPRHVLYCGPAAHWSWQDGPSSLLDPRTVDAAAAWARAAVEQHCRLTVVSSDAIFTGPWMFHREESGCLCESVQARTIRAIEQAVHRQCSEALLIRTSAFGWTPKAIGTGWIETALAALERGTARDYDCLRHATPILASDLAAVLEAAWRKKLTGTYHVAGAERSNPARFVAALATEFGLPVPEPRIIARVSERPVGFGRGETSLHTTRIRRALGVALPMLADGLKRLHEQDRGGRRDRLNAPAAVKEKVA
ncbi:MAG: sugar nucleotide-binding protein, partial [Planctomycetaceae bacterium]